MVNKNLKNMISMELKRKNGKGKNNNDLTTLK